MPLSRPRANSLQLSIERTKTWCPPRPPTPRRSTYPQAGTISLSMAGIGDSDIPPVPPLSYWEPDTPSPVSPHNPFLIPPRSGLDSPCPVASPLLPDSPLSIFDRQISPASSSSHFPRSSPLTGPISHLDSYSAVATHQRVSSSQIAARKEEFDDIFCSTQRVGEDEILGIARCASSRAGESV